jgi:hypothetical protein
MVRLQSRRPTVLALCTAPCSIREAGLGRRSSNDHSKPGDLAEVRGAWEQQSWSVRGQQTGSNLLLEGPEWWRRNRDELWGHLSTYGRAHLRVSHDPSSCFTPSNYISVIRCGI